MNIDNLDFVYIIKPNEKGDELRYSLRSIDKHYPNHKVWIVGYKPSWVQNVQYLPTKQTGTKWSNSTNNVISICNCPEISEDFILMNDDFFCINPTMSLEDIIDSNFGLLDDVVYRYRNLKSGWARGFKYINELMQNLNIKGPLYSYEAHLPLKINKKKFLEVISFPEVQKFMQTSKVLHKRTLYKNYDKPEKSIILKTDTKVTLKKDNSRTLIQTTGWLSTADGVLNNPKFPYLNRYLKQNFKTPCKYEKEILHKPTSKKSEFMNF